MESTPKTAVWVGIFFTVGLVALLGLSLIVSEARFGARSYNLAAYFKEGQGLEIGSNVTLRGVPIGTVREIAFDPSGPEGKRVRILLEIEDRYRLPVDSVASVRFQSLLGQNFVYVLDGDSAQTLKPNETLQTEEGADLQKVITQISGLGESAQTLLEDFREKGGRALDQFAALIEENRENVKNTTSAFAEAAPRIEALATNLNELITNISEGRGTLGKLATDDTAYNNFVQISEDVKVMLAKVRAGEGTLGKIINEDQMYTTVETAFSDVGKAAREAQALLGENREDVRAFIEQLSSVGPDLRDTLSNFNAITTKVNRGEGTLGKLVNDPSLYDDVRRAVNQIGETFEGGEEQGVIRSFFGVLFGALL